MLTAYIIMAMLVIWKEVGNQFWIQVFGVNTLCLVPCDKIHRLCVVVRHRSV